MSDKKWEETIRHARTCGVGDDLKRVPEMSTMIGAQSKVTCFLSAAAYSCAYKQLYTLLREHLLICFPDSIKNCELESYEPSCSNPPDGSQRELSAGNVTPGLAAAACALEQLPSLQRAAGAGNQNSNPSDSIGGIMEAQQQQQDHLGDQGGLAALWSPLCAWQQCGSSDSFCGTGESPDEIDIGDLWQ
ncbi:unnamed protein product [Musa textilis]